MYAAQQLHNGPQPEETRAEHYDRKLLCAVIETSTSALHGHSEWDTLKGCPTLLISTSMYSYCSNRAVQKLHLLFQMLQAVFEFGPEGMLLQWQFFSPGLQ